MAHEPRVISSYFLNHSNKKYMSEKRILIVGGASGIGMSVREAIALSNIKNSGVEVIEYKPENSEIKELAEQLVSMSEIEVKAMREMHEITMIPRIEEPFIPKAKHCQKGHKRPYKFHK